MSVYFKICITTRIWSNFIIMHIVLKRRSLLYNIASVNDDDDNNLYTIHARMLTSFHCALAARARSHLFMRWFCFEILHILYSNAAAVNIIATHIYAFGFFLIYLHTKHSSSFFSSILSTSYTTRRPHKLQCFVFFRPSQHKPFEFQIKHLHLQRKCNYIAHTVMALATNIMVAASRE